jgi:hypothetical protein
MPYSTSVPMTRMTLIHQGYGLNRTSGLHFRPIRLAL